MNLARITRDLCKVQGNAPVSQIQNQIGGTLSIAVLRTKLNAQNRARLVTCVRDGIDLELIPYYLPKQGWPLGGFFKANHRNLFAVKTAYVRALRRRKSQNTYATALLTTIRKIEGDKNGRA